MKTMKVGFLTERMILGFGVDLVVHEVARRLSEKKHEATVFTTRTEEIYRDVNYRIVNLLERAKGPGDIFSPHFMIESIHFLRVQDIDVWIAETPPFYSWLHHLRPPVVMVEHGTPDGRFFSEAIGRELDESTRHRYEVVYQSLRPGDAVVATSEYIRSVMPLQVRVRTQVIHLGGDHYSKATTGQTDEFRRSLGILPDEIMILWVGRMEPFYDWQPYKGLKEFMELAPVLKQRYPACRIVAVGRGEENAREPLENAGIQPVFNLPIERMPAAFGAADIYLNTSQWEGFNLPLVEAQYQGTPVVAYNLCAHPEVTENGVSGILVNSRDELIQSVGRLLEDPDYRRQLSLGAEKQAARFSWDRNASDLETLMIDCFDRADRSGQCMAKTAKIQKLPPYFLWKFWQIIRRYGWQTFIKKIIGWILGRLPG